MNDYYKILQVSHYASDNEIKRAFRVLAKKWHPDRNHEDENTAEIFKIINEAYSVLSNPVLKAAYDDKLKIYMLNMNVAHVKEETAESKMATLFNKICTVVDNLIFEDEHENKMGYIKQKFLNLSKTKRAQKLRAKIVDLMYEEED